MSASLSLRIWPYRTISSDVTRLLSAERQYPQEMSEGSLLCY